MPNSAVTDSALYLAVNETRRLPALLAAVWFCGFGVVLAAWYLRWRSISAAIRKAVPLHDGREVRVLRRMERIAGIQRPMAMFLCTASLGAGDLRHRGTRSTVAERDPRLIFLKQIA